MLVSWWYHVWLNAEYIPISGLSREKNEPGFMLKRSLPAGDVQMLGTRLISLFSVMESILAVPWPYQQLGWTSCPLKMCRIVGLARISPSKVAQRV
jgi:hypothetical protein